LKFRMTAVPITAEGIRKGEPSRRIVRNDLRIQPALSVRGSSRRIMSMRFRPAYISLINRRASFPAVIGTAAVRKSAPGSPAGTCSRRAAHRSRARCQNGARRQGFAAPRPTTARPCPLRAVPAGSVRDGRLRREHLAALGLFKKEKLFKTHHTIFDRA
jgi:hypothetical protein